MIAVRPISDRAVVLICRAIGICSLILSVTAMTLTARLWKVSSRRIVVVLLLLQTQFAIYNLFFAVGFVPYFYLNVGGGYCMGLLCEPHHVPFEALMPVCMGLCANLWALFMVLLFYRHQSLVRPTSRVKFSHPAQYAITFVLIAGMNILPPIQAYETYTAAPSDFCQPCDWIEQKRNFGVIPVAAAIVSFIIIVICWSAYSAFAVACTTHIIMTIKEYERMISNGSVTTKINGTKQSLVQVSNQLECAILSTTNWFMIPNTPIQFATFAVFLAVPMVLIMSIVVFKFEDDLFVQIPALFLFSLCSPVQSILTIIYSPFAKSKKQSKKSVSVASLATSKTKQGS